MPKHSFYPISPSGGGGGTKGLDPYILFIKTLKSSDFKYEEIKIYKLKNRSVW